LERLIGLGKGCRTGLRRVAEMPEHAATNDGGEIYFVGETAAVLLIGQEVDGQEESTPRQHDHQTVLPQRTDQTVERHGRNMIEHRAQL
jgi:hypothetical protein